MSVKKFAIDSPVKRLLLAAVVVVAVLGALVTVRWGIGNTISSDADAIEITELAIGLAPDDPQTHFAAGVLRERTFEPEDILAAVREFERAAALSPNNFLIWQRLARAREAAGDRDGAEAAFRRTAELAPNYSRVRWALGNILLRQGRTGEAFAEMRAAADADANYQQALLTTASQIFGGDTAAVREAVGRSPGVLKLYALSLAKAKQFDEAFEVWRSLSPDDQRAGGESGRMLLAQLIEGQRFSMALQLANTLEDQPKYTAGSIFNGGFENAIAAQSAPAFEWQIAAGTQPQIALTDGQRRSGTYSLLLIFRSSQPAEFRGISQTVVVEQSNSYRFEAFYRSDLKTTAKLRWQIATAGGQVLATTDAVGPSADWKALQCDFVAPPGTEAVVARLARDECFGTACSVAGNLWFDDVSINAR